MPMIDDTGLETNCQDTEPNNLWDTFDPWSAIRATQNNCNSTDDTLPLLNFENLVFVIDTSGSMSGRGISALNAAMADMIDRLYAYSTKHSERQWKISILTFNTRAEWVIAGSEPFSELFWNDLEAGGATFWSPALDELKLFLDSLNKQLNYGGFAPTIIFTADGVPGDDWSNQYIALKESRLFRAASKFAIAIGEDPSVSKCLSQLTSTREVVFSAEKTDDISKCFNEIFDQIIKWGSLRIEPPMGEIECEHDEDLAFVSPPRIKTDRAYAKCRLLKSIRKAIADANDIPYEITDCEEDGQCRGTCPHCDQEAQLLSKQLAERAASGKPLVFPSADTSLLDAFLPNKSPEDIWGLGW